MIIDKKAIYTEYKMAYSSKLSFSYICIGYFWGVYGDLGGRHEWAIVLIGGLTSLIIFLSNKIIDLYINRRIASEITIEELKRISVAIDTSQMRTVNNESTNKKSQKNKKR